MPEDENAGLEVEDKQTVGIDVNTLVRDEQLFVCQPSILPVSNAHVTVTDEELRVRVQEKLPTVVLWPVSTKLRGFALL